MGYRFQFVTLAGFHSLNLAMFNLARDYRERGMAAYSELQQAEFAAETAGYTATRHQREVGVGYFDAIAMAISGGSSSTAALAGSTEAAQFQKPEAPTRSPYGHDEGLGAQSRLGRARLGGTGLAPYWHVYCLPGEAGPGRGTARRCRDIGKISDD